jgi:transcriptional regulator GlxA family with amidase domain
VPQSEPRPLEAQILALPETAGSALYGMVDILAATGTLWPQLVDREPGFALIRPRVVGLSREPFRCGNGIPVVPDLAIGDAPPADFVILPELWLPPDDDMKGRHPQALGWIRQRHAEGSVVYSACSGSVLLAASGLLNGREATSHWGYQDLFRTRFPDVRFRPEPNLVFADAAGRIVTAGGTTSWHDLAIHIISRHCSPGEALRIARLYLLKWHGEGQRPYTSLVRRQPHADAMVRQAEAWLAGNPREANPVAAVVTALGVPERTLKRRFKMATGSTIISYAQNLRIEAAKRLLETTTDPVEDISDRVGYDNPAFFRRLFRRYTGMTPAQYRQMFMPFAVAATPPPARKAGATES